MFVTLCMHAEYKTMVGPQPFSDQNTGLTNQTCNHLAICTDQFSSRNLHFSAIVLLAHTQHGQSIFQKADQISHWLAIMS